MMHQEPQSKPSAVQLEGILQGIFPTIYPNSQLVSVFGASVMLAVLLVINQLLDLAAKLADTLAFSMVVTRVKAATTAVQQAQPPRNVRGKEVRSSAVFFQRIDAPIARLKLLLLRQTQPMGHRAGLAT